MDIKEAKERKKDLEQNIYNLLNEYYKYTTLRVKHIDIFWSSAAGEIPEGFFDSVKVKIEL